ncbi:phage major tail tube protein [Escherichia coli]|uniref:phage major tail tube protein n=1 Tax=Escherichia coli TaxID=562 RepID=UPI00135D771C|nr:phage major tail tube protein [Escherichia coli]MXF04478.1 phage major tail tube protein [Escherichia coli]
MGLPAKLKNFNIFVDGRSMIGTAQELTLPKLTQKLIAYRGGGMMAAVNVAMGLDDNALDMDITVGGLEPALLEKLAVSTADGMQLRFQGAFQDDSDAHYTTCVIQTRGRFTEVDWGNAKVGEDTTHKYTLKNTYVKITVDEKNLYEVDALNMIWVVGGVDKTAEMRKALGL